MFSKLLGCKGYIALVVFPWLAVLTVNSNHVHLDCDREVVLISPDGPLSSTGDVAVTMTTWSISAPLVERILIRFNHVPDGGRIYLADTLSSLNSQLYEIRDGSESMYLPPYVSQGNHVNMTFTPSHNGGSEACNISASCFSKEVSVVGIRLAGESASPEEGLVEIVMTGESWTRFCEDDFETGVADVICRQLGYPAADRVAFLADGCLDRSCYRPPICFPSTYRLQDCSYAMQPCTSTTALQVRCHKPGFIGCYLFAENILQGAFASGSPALCASSCQSDVTEKTAVHFLEEQKCSCLSENNLTSSRIASARTTMSCRQCRAQLEGGLPCGEVHKGSIGLCNRFDVPNGELDSTITWLGSIVDVRCDDGYVLERNSTVQCVPSESTYFPVWNTTLPSCKEAHPQLPWLPIHDVMPQTDGSNITIPEDDLILKEPACQCGWDISITHNAFLGSTIGLGILILLGVVAMAICRIASRRRRRRRMRRCQEEKTDVDMVEVANTYHDYHGYCDMSKSAGVTKAKLSDLVHYESVQNAPSDPPKHYENCSEEFRDPDEDAFGYIMPNPKPGPAPGRAGYTTSKTSMLVEHDADDCVAPNYATKISKV